MRDDIPIGSTRPAASTGAKQCCAHSTTTSRGAFDLGGIKLVDSGAEHQGSRFVDLSMVARDGRFVH
jgi:hypothetical protein